jgi:Putative zinc-finger
MKHSEIIELLPWYANSTLPEDERKVVETHLADCSECARELKNLSTMQKAVVEIGNKAPAPSANALNRALAQIEDYERARQQAAKQEAPGPGIVQRISSLWSSWWSPTPLMARAIIAVQLVLVLGFGATILYQHNQSNIYTTASGPSGDKTSTRIAVSFSDGATEQEIRQAILAVHGKIIDGPSALGLYTVQVPISPERSHEVDNVLKILRQNQRVIRFAEQKQ